eukprot:COSAG06_NODE_3871_length_4815_cov_3.565946_2_plen_167_part_00
MLQLEVADARDQQNERLEKVGLLVHVVDLGNSLCRALKHFVDILQCVVAQARDLGCHPHRQQLVEMFAAQDQREGRSEQARSARTARAWGRCGREVGRDGDGLARSRSCKDTHTITLMKCVSVARSTVVLLENLRDSLMAFVSAGMYARSSTCAARVVSAWACATR